MLSTRFAPPARAPSVAGRRPETAARRMGARGMTVRRAERSPRGICSRGSVFTSSARSRPRARKGETESETSSTGTCRTRGSTEVAAVVSTRGRRYSIWSRRNVRARQRLRSIVGVAAAGLGAFALVQVASASSPAKATAPTFESETAYLNTPVAQPGARDHGLLGPGLLARGQAREGGPDDRRAGQRPDPR